MKPIHIFKTGTHTDSHGQTLTFSEADLAMAVSAYNPDIHQAPIVVGHPKTDAPAYGWVQNLSANNGNLYATPEQVNTEFSEQVKAGSYKKVSASFYPPNSPNNPVKGVYYLRHVGFLGAEPPAIKGLSPVEFSEKDDAVTLTFDFSEADQPSNASTATHLTPSGFDKFMTKFKAFLFGEDSQTPTVQIAQPNTDHPPLNEPQPKDVNVTTQTPTTSAPVAPATNDKDAKIAELQKQLADKEQAERNAQIEAAQKSNADFAESLANDGKITPKDTTLVSAILDALDRDSRNAPVEFGEGDAKKPLAQAVKDKLSATDGKAFSYLFSESAGKPAKPANFEVNVPSGTQVDSDSMAKHQEILAYAEANKVDYVTAAIALGG
ncbi:peptidase [Moraxella osloensis]|nr:peptidase [Moraxella osloensis]QRO13084.1 peptidase [Moraxella osloensis]